MEDIETKKYISNMNKIISRGNPKYVSYVSREYMNAKRNNPILSMILEEMIKKEAKETGSIYAIFIDNDNTINLEAMSDISKITNVAEFIKNIEALAGQKVDFGELTSDELIIEGMEIAEELARQIDEIEQMKSQEIDESVTQNAEAKVNSLTGKIALTGVRGIFQTIINFARNKLSLLFGNIRNNIDAKKNTNLENENPTLKDVSKGNKKESEDFIPKFDIDEAAAIRKMQESRNAGKSKLKSNDITDDFSGDSSEDDFDSTDDDNNTAQEDDEPDI